MSSASRKTHVAELAIARQYAESGLFDDFLNLCRHVSESLRNDLTVQLDVGALLACYGFLSDSRACYNRAHSLAPTDLRAMVNLANLMRDAGEHAGSRCLYADLLRQLPNHPIIRRNFLACLEYDPGASDAERREQAQAWGEWAISRVGGMRPRPALLPLKDRPLRIGYVSADLCQHTVGLFVKDVLKTHDPARVQVLAYSAGQAKDWVTDEICAAAAFRDVSTFDDGALSDLIRSDGIDVLVDLSGHTAGSRLTAFTLRPAPVMLSWLGYFATTGLPYMDAVLLDEWHAPPGTEAQFVEPILRMPSGRFCYRPLPWTPTAVSAPAFERNGFITFGCFNNTAKFNTGVFDAWARVLRAVPDARLILKWRAFNDEAFRQQVIRAFVDREIPAERIELRGPSFHAQLLGEYADIDIALDPFPFTGGLTSCEALWMGVPVVTWPQSRVVGRQTYAFLSQVGLPELAAEDADGYIRIAVELASDTERLALLRSTLRDKMRTSPLMDAAGFTRQLEDTLTDLYRRIEAEEREKAMSAKTVLHVGSGHRHNGAQLPSVFQGSGWTEVRLDIDPINEPDIVGSMLDMTAVRSESVDAIYSSHTIEHLYPNEIPEAIDTLLRVLKPAGYAIITCPDLQAAAEMIAKGKLMEVAYPSPAGPVTPFDILYSHRLFTGRDKPFMAHHCGFTLDVLMGTLKSNGFAAVAGKRRPAAFDLWVVATKQQMEEDELRALAARVLPN